MTARNRPLFGAAHIGPLLLPEALLKSWDQWKAGDMNAKKLRSHEASCIKNAEKQ